MTYQDRIKMAQKIYDDAADDLGPELGGRSLYDLLVDHMNWVAPAEIKEVMPFVRTRQMKPGETHDEADTLADTIDRLTVQYRDGLTCPLEYMNAIHTAADETYKSLKPGTCEGGYRGDCADRCPAAPNSNTSKKEIKMRAIHLILAPYVELTHLNADWVPSGASAADVLSTEIQDDAELVNLVIKTMLHSKADPEFVSAGDPSPVPELLHEAYLDREVPVMLKLRVTAPESVPAPETPLAVTSLIVNAIVHRWQLDWEFVDYPNTARKAKDLNSRIDTALDAADIAFWAVIAEHFPEAKTGDFDPGAAKEHYEANKASVRHWLSLNTDLITE